MRFRKTLPALLFSAALVVPAAQAVTLAPASGAAATGKKANIFVIASKSFCIASGISDVYTGNGKIIFYLTLRNSGAVAGKVDIVPVRHYDDGESNESAMDMLIDVQVPAHAVRKFRSPAYSYKAHEHDVESCGVKIDGRREVAIRAVHL